MGKIPYATWGLGRPGKRRNPTLCSLAPQENCCTRNGTIAQGIRQIRIRRTLNSRRPLSHLRFFVFRKTALQLHRLFCHGFSKGPHGCGGTPPPPLSPGRAARLLLVSHGEPLDTRRVQRGRCAPCAVPHASRSTCPAVATDQRDPQFETPPGQREGCRVFYTSSAPSSGPGSLV